MEEKVIKRKMKFVIFTALAIVTAALASILFYSLKPNLVQGLNIIAHSDFPERELSRNKARAIFSGRISKLPDGTDITVFVYGHNDPKHMIFCKDKLDIFPRQLFRSWDRIVFSGRGSGPTIVNSETEMIKLVGQTPGSIGYVVNTPVAENTVIHINEDI